MTLLDTGYTTRWRLRPRFSVVADISNGDNPKTNTWGRSMRSSLKETTLGLTLSLVRSTSETFTPAC